MILGVAIMLAPLVGVAEPDDYLCHRVNRDGLPIRDWATAASSTAACGAQVELLGLTWRDLRTRGTSYTRCKPCREWKKP